MGHTFVITVAAHGARGTVTMRDTATGSILNTVTVGVDPDWIAVDARAQYVFVANRGSDSVSLLDTATGNVMRTVLLGAAPLWISVDDTTGEVYILDAGSYGVSVLDSATGDVMALPNVATLDLVQPKVQMLGLINADRTQAGLAPLTPDAALDAIAQARSQDMVIRHYFSHQIPGVGTFVTILDRAGVPYTMAGENLALNNYTAIYPMAQAIERTNADLMNSPEHRANILEPGFTRVGLGLAFQPGNDILIVTEVFVQP